MKIFKRIPLNLAAILFWIAAWHIGAAAANKSLLLKIPTPYDTLLAFCENLNSADFWGAVGTSLMHICSGFICAAALGLVLGMLSGAIKSVKALSAPIIHLIRSVPVAAFIILAWLWIPTGILPAFISFLMVFPIVFSRAQEGVLTTDKALLEMAQVMRLTRTKALLNITLPNVLPRFREACISGLGFAWKSGVAAEVICNPTGSIGALLSKAKQTIDYPQVFAITLTIVLLSLLLENIIKIVWRERKYD